MKLFTCSQCGNLLYFENTHCMQCQARLGFQPDSLQLEAIQPINDTTWQTRNSSVSWRLCRNNVDYQACNWLIEADSTHEYCRACQLNHTVPDLSNPTHKTLWQRLEMEKRLLIYSLLRLGLSVVSRHDSEHGLAFDFLAGELLGLTEQGRVLTGHAAGLITLNLAEADPVIREQIRHDMAEPYRTVLGHFRHESGHYYWDRLVAERQRLDEWRAIFGDETLDYAAALQQHYQRGPATDWADEFVSAYASCHPWEDWAETWAHYLHIVDTLETAHAFGLRISPSIANHDVMDAAVEFDAYREANFSVLIEHWMPLTVAMNSLNRSMGHDYVYPFVLTPRIVDKLAFVHRVICDQV